MANGTGLCLPVFVGDPDTDASAFSSLPPRFSGISIRETVAAMLGMGSAVKIGLAKLRRPSNQGPLPSSSLDLEDSSPDSFQALDLSQLTSAVVALLRGAQREAVAAEAQAQYYAVRHRMQKQWRRVEAILALGNEIGKGGYSTVYAGVCDLGPVAVKVMRVNNAEAHRFKDFDREVAAMRSLDHPVRWL